MNYKKLFYSNLAQTSDFPMALEIERADGMYLYGASGKKYLDMISGIAVSNLGHSHPNIVEAVKKQAEKYMHLMVYGEFVQAPQVQLAQLLLRQLPEKFNNIYLVNSGSEANETALKLAKKFSGRPELIAFDKAYHGGTHGVLSLMGDKNYRNAFQPLLPKTKHLEYNNLEQLTQISEQTAAVLVEPVQAEAGIIAPENNFLQHLRKRCDETGALLIFDEIQTGFGRTGHLFAFQKYQVLPDIITIAKAFGGGMPLGGVVAPKALMETFMSNPVLGHITTFGGHPVSAAAALAALEVILQTNLLESIPKKAELLLSLLKHPAIRQIRGLGLWYALEFDSFDLVQNIIKRAVENGLIIDWFLFNNTSIRLAPPLIINKAQIAEAVTALNRSIDEALEL